jgi:hypothetical protein
MGHTSDLVRLAIRGGVDADELLERVEELLRRELTATAYAGSLTPEEADVLWDDLDGVLEELAEHPLADLVGFCVEHFGARRTDVLLTELSV